MTRIKRLLHLTRYDLRNLVFILGFMALLCLEPLGTLIVLGILFAVVQLSRPS